MKIERLISTITLGLCITTGLHAAEHTVAQKNKAFTTDEITIKVGDVINFENQDSFFHNVFSLSDDRVRLC